MSASDYTYLEIDLIVKETSNAFLVRIKGEEHWLPFSQVADYEDYSEGDKNVGMSVKTWLAEDRGLA